MRFGSRLLLLVFAVTVVSIPALADHFDANCQLTNVGSAPSNAVFEGSPHGVFRNNNVIYALRGQRLITQQITTLGNIEVVRDDLLPTMAARDEDGGAAYRNGYLYVSGEGGLETFDLRNTRPGAGATAPVLTNRIPGAHYRRMVTFGNLLAAVYPIDEYPCFPDVGNPNWCRNYIDIYSIVVPSEPVRMSRISASGIGSFYIGFNDVAWANGYLWATGWGGTFAWDVSNPSVPMLARSIPVVGRFLTSNNASLLAIGQDQLIAVVLIGPGTIVNYFHVFTLPSIVGSINEHRFHYDAYIDDSRLVTLIDEIDPMTRRAARTVAIDVFDFQVPLYDDGFDDRIYENVSFTYPDEVKHDPLMVGSFVHVIGEASGVQTWGACGVASGRVELEHTINALSCNGSELHGWVTGPNRISRVELFLDDRPIGTATLTNNRTDVPSSTPVLGWKLAVNFDLETAGIKTLRMVATDVFGARRQVYSQLVQFGGPGNNCVSRRRAASR